MNTNTTRRRDGTGTVACLGTTACHGAGFAYTGRSFSGWRYPAAAVSASQLGAAAVELAAVTGTSSTLPSVTASIGGIRVARTTDAHGTPAGRAS
jgi:hypothetical protein